MKKIILGIFAVLYIIPVFATTYRITFPVKYQFINLSPGVYTVTRTASSNSIVRFYINNNSGTTVELPGDSASTSMTMYGSTLTVYPNQNESWSGWVDLDIVASSTPLTVTSSAELTAVAGTFFGYQASASGGSGSYTYSFSGYSSWLTASGSQLTGTVPAGTSVFTFTVTVSDGLTSKSKAVVVTVGNNSANVPVITSADTVNQCAGNFYYKITATGAAPLTYSVLSCPASLSFDSSTGVISGLVDASNNGSLIFIKVSNEYGSASKSVQVNVSSEFPPAPTSTSLVDVNIASSTGAVDVNLPASFISGLDTALGSIYVRQGAMTDILTLMYQSNGAFHQAVTQNQITQSDLLRDLKDIHSTAYTSIQSALDDINLDTNAINDNTFEIADNTSRTADNTDQLVIDAGQIVDNTGRTADNTGLIADDTGQIADDMGVALEKLGSMDTTLSDINNKLAPPTGSPSLPDSSGFGSVRSNTGVETKLSFVSSALTSKGSTAPVLVIPFSSVYDGLSDVSLNFGEEPYLSWCTALRVVFEGLLYLFGLYWLVKIINGFTK